MVIYLVVRWWIEGAQQRLWERCFLGIQYRMALQMDEVIYEGRRNLIWEKEKLTGKRNIQEC